MMLKPSQRWAVVAAWASVIGGLLPVIWRVHMLAWGAGWSLADRFRSELLWYVVGLIVVETVASILPLALVQPWGEVWPRWLPGLAGRRIPARLVIVVASLGACALTLIIATTAVQLVTMTLRGISNPILQVEAGWLRAFMLAHYVPWVLWPAGLWVAIVGFARRNCRRTSQRVSAGGTDA